MPRITGKQARELRRQAFFWAAHASHWGVAALFLVLTFTILYTLWGNDAAFAAVIIGRW